jgi:hypothetical protein
MLLLNKILTQLDDSMARMLKKADSPANPAHHFSGQQGIILFLQRISNYAVIAIRQDILGAANTHFP